MRFRVRNIEILSYRVHINWIFKGFVHILSSHYNYRSFCYHHSLQIIRSNDVSELARDVNSGE